MGITICKTSDSVNLVKSAYRKLCPQNIFIMHYFVKQEVKDVS